jgi:hypothetical protein
MNTTSRIAFALALVSSVACGTQQSDSYEGDAIASIHGTVTAAGAESPPASDLKLSIVWQDGRNLDRSIGLRADARLQGQFPSRFTLDILLPPPAYAMFESKWGDERADPNNNRIAIGGIIVVPSSFSSGEIKKEDFAGISENYMLVYAEKDILEGSVESLAFHGAVTAKGYHLLKVTRLGQTEKAAASEIYSRCRQALGPLAGKRREFEACGYSPSFDALSLAPQDLATEIDVKVAPLAQLDFPNWT